MNRKIKCDRYSSMVKRYPKWNSKYQLFLQGTFHGFASTNPLTPVNPKHRRKVNFGLIIFKPIELFLNSFNDFLVTFYNNMYHSSRMNVILFTLLKSNFQLIDPIHTKNCPKINRGRLFLLLIWSSPVNHLTCEND